MSLKIYTRQAIFALLTLGAALSCDDDEKTNPMPAADSGAGPLTAARDGSASSGADAAGWDAGGTDGAAATVDSGSSSGADGSAGGGGATAPPPAPGTAGTTGAAGSAGDGGTGGGGGGTGGSGGTGGGGGAGGASGGAAGSGASGAGGAAGAPNPAASDPLKSAGPSSRFDTGLVNATGAPQAFMSAVGYEGKLVLVTGQEADAAVLFTPPSKVEKLSQYQLRNVARGPGGLVHGATNGTLYRFQPDLSRSSELAFGADFAAYALAASNDGTLYTSKGAGAGIWRLSPGGRPEELGQASIWPFILTLAPGDRTIYATGSAGSVVACTLPEAPQGQGKAKLPCSNFATDAKAARARAVDEHGNVYLTTATGIEVRRPDGTSWPTRIDVEAPGALAFGGKQGRTLFYTAKSVVYWTELAVRGYGAGPLR